MKFEIKNKIFSLVTVLTLLVIIFSCADFEEINTNPNNPEVVPINSLMVDILRRPISSYHSLGETYGNLSMQHTARLMSAEIDVYIWHPHTGLWNNAYRTLREIESVTKMADRDNMMNYKGVVMVIRAFIVHVLTDFYGDVPYSEAASEVFTPKYDRQEDIYNALLADLRTANELLGATGERVRNDILFDGDITKWKKFANSLRVRILMRLSERNDPSSELREILGNSSNYPIFESNNDNAALTYTTSPGSQYPTYSWAGGTWFMTSMSNTLVDRLLELNDMRLKVYAAENDEGEYMGAQNGLDINPPDLPYSFRGLLYSPFFVDGALPNAAQTVLMDYAELQFILAEAAERGFILGDAANHYYAGIQASFDYYTERASVFGFSAQPAEGFDYLEQDDVAYNGSQQERLEKIAEQKWIHLFNSIEKYFDWKRTGLPVMLPGPDARNNGNIPRRMVYPPTEHEHNEIRYREAIDRIGGDDINARVWWDVE